MKQLKELLEGAVGVAVYLRPIRRTCAVRAIRALHVSQRGEALWPINRHHATEDGARNCRKQTSLEQYARDAGGGLAVLEPFPQLTPAHYVECDLRH